MEDSEKLTLVANPEIVRAPELDELEQRVNALFDQQIVNKLEMIKKENQALVTSGIKKQDEADAELRQEQEKAEQLDVYAKIKFLLNNFYFWLPGGVYRELLESVKQSKSLGDDRLAEIAFREKLISDIDAILLTAGYQAIGQELSDPKNH